ncbi:hypothetical protein L1987_46740 [Smallanthus sonchifolius]|uniref:Uncharacterized protein n=1 Tax=Smallanthus sonchifolius TaxID=185202 RepID=A0ACB9G0H1_9ASTR|nr:hypothetical protein L1987_46740 [Smallanthus sonchifolius]
MEQMKSGNHEDKTIESATIFDQKINDHFPKQFIWPKDHLSQTSTEKLNEQVIDLQGFLSHDEEATLLADNLVKESCLSHGFFQVVNHGVDPALLALAHEHGRAFFKLPLTEKLKCKQKEGSVVGFACAHAQRFREKLPWKELLTFEYHENGTDEVTAEFFNALGSQYKETGLIFQKFCRSMNKLALDIMELLEISLGVDGHKHNYYRQLFEDSVSIALSNGKYKSCLHRVSANRYKPRLSLAFFLCPKGDRELKAPQDLVDKDGRKEYPDFTWEEFLQFTQKNHRADENTLDEFTKWLLSSKKPNA